MVGASFAGKKAMTATSGPGMSLKTEMLGLASIAELPLVCVNVQRGGPSTGMPTKAEQSDLFQAAFSAHGDCLRPVLAPTSVGDMFGITVEAFNLAEYYQTPVIVLSDQEIAQRKETVEPIDTSTFQIVERRRPTEAELANYARFKLTESGISPISHPGMAGGNYLAAGIEHNELGRPTASGEMHARMNEKRFHKFNPLKNRRDLFAVEGDPDAPIGLVSWGSVAGVAQGSAAAGAGGRLARRNCSCPSCSTRWPNRSIRTSSRRSSAGCSSSNPSRRNSTGWCGCTWIFRPWSNRSPRAAPTQFSRRKCSNGCAKWSSRSKATATTANPKPSQTDPANP